MNTYLTFGLLPSARWVCPHAFYRLRYLHSSVLTVKFQQKMLMRSTHTNLRQPLAQQHPAGHEQAHLTLQELSDLIIADVRVWVPDDHGVLTAAADLVYNDAPWLGAQQEAAHLVHPKISFEVRTRASIFIGLLASACRAESRWVS